MPAPSTTGGALMGYPTTVDNGLIIPWYLTHESNAGVSAAGSGTLVTNTTYLVGVYLPVPAIVTNMRIRKGTTSAGNMDLGIFDSSGNRLDHTGVIGAGSTNTDVTHALSGGNLSLSPGRYYLALWIDNNTDVYYRVNTGNVNTSWAEILVGAAVNGTGATNTTTGLLSTFTAMTGTTVTGALIVSMMALLSGGHA
jgi:hypothetical protein